MSVELNFSVTQHLGELNKVTIQDTTGIYDASDNENGWGVPNTELGDVLHARFIATDYVFRQKEGEESKTLEEGVEYINNGNDVISFDNKNIAPGRKVVPRADHILTSGSMAKTGFYHVKSKSFYGDFEVNEEYELFSESFNKHEDKFPSKPYTLIYEAYSDSNVQFDGAGLYVVVSDPVVPETEPQYIEYEDPEGNLSRYYPGEVFEFKDEGDVIILSKAKMGKLIDSRLNNYLHYGEVFFMYKEILDLAAGNYCNHKDEAYARACQTLVDYRALKKSISEISYNPEYAWRLIGKIKGDHKYVMNCK